MVSRYWSAILLASVLLVFGLGCLGEFVWDDTLLVEQNRITDGRNLLSAFTGDLWANNPGMDLPSGYYRPLLLLDLALDRGLFGLQPSWHRFHNLLWHGLDCLLLYLLLLGLGLGRPARMLALSVFAIHPLQTEPVLFVSARNDLMATGMLLGALLVLMEKGKGRSDEEPALLRLLAGGLLAAGACLSKETAYLGPVFLLILSFTWHGTLPRLRSLLAMASGPALALLLRYLAGIGWPQANHPGQLPAVVLPSLGLAAGRFFWPVDLAPVVNLPTDGSIHWLPLLSLMALFGLLLAFGRRVGLGGLLFGALALFPSLTVISQTGLLGDRYLYLPLVGLCIALAAGIHGATENAPSRERIALLAWLPLTLLLTAATSRQVPTWYDDTSFWEAAVARSPSTYTHKGLAKTLENAGHLDRAAQQYALAIVAPRPDPYPCYNITSVHLKRGDPASAVRAGRSALERGCEASPELLAPLAVALAATASWDQAEELAASIGKDPTGLAVVVRVAAAFRRGDTSPLLAEAQQNSVDTSPLVEQAAWLLEQGGDPGAAAALRNMKNPEETP